MNNTDREKILTAAVKIFGHALSMERGSDNVDMQCYCLQEAIRRVAHGGEPKTFIGKAPMEMIASRESYAFLRDTAWGAYYLAREQVARAVIGKNLRLFGIIWNDKIDIISKGEVFYISPDKIDDLDIFEEDEETPIQGIIFDELVVEAAKLEEIFAFGPTVSELTKVTIFSNIADGAGHQGPYPQIGRPRKWDWERILREVVILANTPDGLPDKQSDLEAWVCTRCGELFGQEPSTSQIRKKLAPIYQVMRSKGS